MTRGANTYGGAGTLIRHLHEEALHQQRVLDTWTFAAARQGRHRANTPRVSRAWIGADHQDERPALVVLDEAEEAAAIPLPDADRIILLGSPNPVSEWERNKELQARYARPFIATEAGRPRRIRRFLDGAGEPETLNTRTEFTGH